MDIQFPQLRGSISSDDICSPHVAVGQQRHEKCEFGAATVKLVHPSAYRVGPLLLNCGTCTILFFFFFFFLLSFFSFCSIEDK